MSPVRVFLILIFGLTLWAPDVAAQSPSQGSGLPLPRFVSLRADEVNMRTGPGVRYPVDWVYQRDRLPVEVIAEFGTWRKVRDFQGTQGWVHQSMLSGQRAIVILGQTRTVRREPDSSAAAIARTEPGVIGELVACPDPSGWCKVKVEGFDGWLRRVEFWGAYAKEVVR